MKKILYSFIAASLFAVGLTSCDPVDGDDHSLGGENVNTSLLAISATVSADETGQENVITITNNSTLQNGVRYFLSIDGKSLTEAPIGTSISQLVKKAGSYTTTLYAFTRCDQQVATATVTIAKDYEVPHQWVAVDSDDNLGKDFNTKGEMEFWWADGSWNQIGNPQFSYADGVYTIVTSENGGGEWQAQNSIHNCATDITKGQTYDIHVSINASAAVDRFTLKICEETNDDNTLFYDGGLSLSAGDNDIDIIGHVSGGTFTNSKFFVDLGGVASGVTIRISDIIIQKSDVKSDDDDPTKIDWAAVDSELNLAAAYNTKGEMEFWWSDSGWGQIGDPGFSYKDGVYTITVTENGGSEWQAQSSIHAETNIEEGEVYDISYKIYASQDLSRYTFKFCQEDNDDNTLLYRGALELSAGENLVQFPNIKMKTGSFTEGKMFFELGGAPVGMTVEISDIIVQKHKLK